MERAEPSWAGPWEGAVQGQADSKLLSGCKDSRSWLRSPQLRNMATPGHCQAQGPAEETWQSLLVPLAQVEDGVSRTLWD